MQLVSEHHKLRVAPNPRDWFNVTLSAVERLCQDKNEHNIIFV